MPSSELEVSVAHSCSAAISDAGREGTHLAPDTTTTPSNSRFYSSDNSTDASAVRERAGAPPPSPPPPPDVEAAQQVHHRRVTRLQFIAMGLVLMNDSICTTMLFPFVGLFIAHLRATGSNDNGNGGGGRDLGVVNLMNATVANATVSGSGAEGTSGFDERSSSGYFAGLLVGAFQLAQFFAAPRWGHVGDVVGRRPVFLIGLVASSVAVIGFGLSTSVLAAVLLRLLHGTLNANASVAKTYVAEVTTKETQAQGFGMMSVAWSVGALIGPSVGGLLYDPAGSDHLQWLGVSRSSLLGRHPALLPCLASALYGACSAVMCYFFVVESNPRARGLRGLLLPPRQGAPAPATGDDDEMARLAGSAGSSASSASSGTPADAGGVAVPTTAAVDDDQQDEDVAPRRFGFSDMFRHPVLRLCVPMYATLCSFNILFNEGFPLYAVAYRKDEGLEMTSAQVGLVFAINAAVAVVANSTFSAVTKRLPLLQLWRVCMVCFAVVVVGYGGLTTVRAETSSFALLMLAVAFLSVVRTTASTFAFSMCMMFVANAAPPSQIGAVTGLSHGCGSMMRAITPMVGAPIFAWSVSAHHMFPMNHFLIFVLCSVLSLIAYALSLRVSEKDIAPRDGPGAATPPDELPESGGDRDDEEVGGAAASPSPAHDAGARLDRRASVPSISALTDDGSDEEHAGLVS